MTLPPEIVELLATARRLREEYNANRSVERMHAAGDAHMKAQAALHSFCLGYIVGEAA